MFRTPKNKTGAVPSTSEAAGSQKRLKIDLTPKRPMQTQRPKCRPTTPVTPLIDQEPIPDYTRPPPFNMDYRLEGNQEKEINQLKRRQGKLKDLLKSSRNLKKEIYDQAIRLIDEISDNAISRILLQYDSQKWYFEQITLYEKDYANIQEAYYETGEKKQTLRRELSNLKDKMEKETSQIGTQTETTQMTESDKTTEPTNWIGDRKSKQIDELIESNIKLRETLEQTMTRTYNVRHEDEDIDGKGTVRETESAWQRQRRSTTIQPTLYSLAIAPVESLRPSWTAEDVLTKTRVVLDAKTGKVEVERVRKAKDAKVIVSCRSENARKQVKQKLEEAKQELMVQEIKNKDPLIILKDVSKHNTDDEILKALKNQNDDIFNSLKEEDIRLTIAFKRQARNPQAQHVVLRVSPQLWQRSTDRGTLKIDLQRVRVMDQSPLVQCSLCLGYGHSKKFCIKTDESCSHCGGTHKVGKQCADWLAGSPPSCINCIGAKADKTDHNAFDAVCPIRRKWDALARSTVAYS